MFEKFKDHLHQHLPFLKGRKLLLATSGGIDSMVMVNLFQKLHYKIAIAHCNFQLRNVESFEDEKFVVDFAHKHNIPIYTTKFDTQAFANDYKLSIQLAARELRYHWFDELLEEENYDYILTAHHADDNLETFLINLSRGTGLEGLTGIPEQNDQVIRPLLNFSRIEIEAYAQDHKIEWREDSSNASDKYLRNKIRHDLVPLFKALNPNFLSSFQKTQSYLQASKVMADDAAIMVYQQVVSEHQDEIHFDLQKLKQLPNYTSYLYQWLRVFGFTAWEDIYALTDGQSGKQVFSPEYRLLKNRHFLIVAPIHDEEATTEFTIEKNQHEVNFPLKLSFCKAADIGNISNSVIFVDEEKLQFPLTLRKWKTGDVFQPNGMQGQSKKLSKFFKDEKLSLFEKENTWLLCSDDQIVWIVGFRQDERFNATQNTKKILKIAVSL
jgi:tRNA(Ile)-lysidine synthase